MGIMGLLKTAITGGGLSRAKLVPSFSRTASEALEQLNYSDVLVERSWCQGTGCQDYGSSDAGGRLSIRQIRTMLETDVVAQTAREFSGE